MTFKVIFLLEEDFEVPFHFSDILPVYMLLEHSFSFLYQALQFLSLIVPFNLFCLDLFMDKPLLIVLFLMDD